MGLILTGHAYVHKGGQAGHWQMGCHDDGLLAGLGEMTGPFTRRVAQSPCSSRTAGSSPSRTEWHGTTGAFRPCKQRTGRWAARWPRERSSRLSRLLQQRPRRAVQAGFDAVQVHAAHGYLLSEFLSPYFNERTDAYGGSLENRARLPLQVIQAVRETVGDDYPVLVSLNSEDLLDGGLSVEEMVQVAALLQGAGVDAIELSGGTTLALRMGEIERSWGPTKRRRSTIERPQTVQGTD